MIVQQVQLNILRDVFVEVRDLASTRPRQTHSVKTRTESRGYTGARLSLTNRFEEISHPRRTAIAVAIVIASMMMLSSISLGMSQAPPTVLPKSTVNAPSTSPSDLWSNNAYFEREKYVPANDCGGPCQVQEESLIQPPTQPANTVYMYYRPHLDDHWDVVQIFPFKTDGGVSLAY